MGNRDKCQARKHTKGNGILHTGERTSLFHYDRVKGRQGEGYGVEGMGLQYEVHWLMGRYESSSCFSFLRRISNKVIAENEKKGGAGSWSREKMAGWLWTF